MCSRPLDTGGEQQTAASVATLRNPRLTVLVADAHPLFAQTLGRGLARRPGVEVLDGYPRSGMQVAYAAVTRQPDVAVVDLWLQEITGLAATRTIVARSPRTRVVVLGWFHGPAEIERALEGGAAGFVSKQLRLTDIVDAVEYVAAGRRLVFDPNFVVAPDSLPEPPWDAEEPRTGAEAFTPRELEVLRLLGAGLVLEDIGARLGVARKTVRNHLTRILAKTGAHSQLHALAVARERGFLV